MATENELYATEEGPQTVEEDGMNSRDWEHVRMALLIAADETNLSMPNTASRYRVLAERISRRGAL